MNNMKILGTATLVLLSAIVVPAITPTPMATATTIGQAVSPPIWDAVNGFILQGYNVDSVVLPGQGSIELSQREVLVVMSK